MNLEANTARQPIVSMAKPQRIVSLLSAATEILYALGLGDRVVGVSHECDFPPEVADKPRVTRSHIDDSASSRGIDDQVRRMAGGGQSLYDIDEPALARLAPDLVVTQAQCDVCAVKYDDVVATVERLWPQRQIPVVALNPMSLADIFFDIRRVGDATGSSEVATAFVGELQRRVAAVRDKTTGLAPDERPRTAIIEWIDPPMLAGNWMPELLEIAGGRCELTTPGRHSHYVAWEELVLFDPQVIVVSPCGFDLSRTLAEARTLTSFNNWTQLSAIRDRRTYAVDGHAFFNRSGPRIVDSLEILAHLLHPDRFAPPLEETQRSFAWCRLQPLA